MKSNLQQDQSITNFGSDFNETHLNYDQTPLPTPTVNLKINQTLVYAITHTSEPKKDNDMTNDFYNVLLGDENDDDDLGLGANSINLSLSQIF